MCRSYFFLIDERHCYRANGFCSYGTVCYVFLCVLMWLGRDTCMWVCECTESSCRHSIYYILINMETKGSVNHTLIDQTELTPLLYLSSPSPSFSVVPMPRTYQYILINVILKACLLSAHVYVDMRAHLQICKLQI